MPIRPVTIDDAAQVAEYHRATREAMARFEPVRPESYFTEGGQADLLSSLVTEAGAGRSFGFLICGSADEMVGRITVNNVVRGAFQSASIGYQVRPDRQRAGHATRAVAEVSAFVFRELGLHRLEAATLVDNVASQGVLAANGFVQYGNAPSYLRIAGDWRDHLLFQCLGPEWQGS